ncbi:Arylsulfotransferase-domain-containing protein [Xylariaceae sp. FL0016]|nr:Arylsulfotransferase-domain-containing protein [Xylariaceae sp. FL0016]
MKCTSWLPSVLLALAIQAAADVMVFNATESFDAGTYGGFPNQTFKTTSATAPLLNVKTWNKNATDDTPYILITGQYSSGNGPYLQNGPLIYRTDDLSLVYVNTTWNESLNVAVQSYKGEDYLTYWEGVNLENNYLGWFGLYDSNYTLRYNMTSKGFNQIADMHDFFLTSNGTALLTTYDQVSPWDTTSVGGKVDDELMDATFEEQDIETGDVLFTWRLSDHVPLNQTYVTYEQYGERPDGGGFDYGHINAVSKTADGNYLASFRHLCAVILINPDGDIVWQLGGKVNNFTDMSGGRATDFCFQHDAHFSSEDLTEVTLFDNAHMDTEVNVTDNRNNSRALHLKLDYENMTATIIHEYYHPDRVVAAAMGGYQTLFNGNKFVAWGFQPTITEFTEDGEVVLDLQLGPYGFPTHEAPEIYRAKKFNWVGTPTWGPSIAGSESNGTNRGVYLSWNGATEVKEWAVLSDNSTDNLDGYSKVVARSPRNGFETFVNVTSPNRYMRAAALDADSKILGSTDAVDMSTGEVIQVNGAVTGVDQPPPSATTSSGATLTGSAGSGETSAEGGVGRVGEDIGTLAVGLTALVGYLVL